MANIDKRIEDLERAYTEASETAKHNPERQRIIAELKALEESLGCTFEERMAREEAEGNFARRRALEELEEHLCRRGLLARLEPPE